MGVGFNNYFSQHRDDHVFFFFSLIGGYSDLYYYLPEFILGRKRTLFSNNELCQILVSHGFC